MNSQSDKVIRRTAMVATVTASYFLLTADYGPGPNALDPIKNVIRSAQHSVRDAILGPKTEVQDVETKKLEPRVTEKGP